jgi:hypothetical protein
LEKTPEQKDAFLEDLLNAIQPGATDASPPPPPQEQPPP